MQSEHARKGPDTSVSGPFLVDWLYQLPKVAQGPQQGWTAASARGTVPPTQRR